MKSHPATAEETSNPIVMSMRIERGAPELTPAPTPEERALVVSMRRVTKVYKPAPKAMRVLVRTSIYDDVVALDGIDFEVREGEIVAIVGPNGAGKTTMFRILTGLTTATTGDVKVLGLDADRQSLDVRKLIGFMPAEDRSLFMRMTCIDNLRFHARLQHIPKREADERCRSMLDEVGLGGREKSNVFSLSAGMRARLQLARALLHRPRLIILDEPTGAVDPVGAHELLDLVQRTVREHRLAALISSHRLEEIEALRSHVVLLDRGHLRYQGDLDRLRAKWERTFVELIFPAESTAIDATQALAGTGTEIARDGARLECHLPSGAPAGELLRWLGPLSHELLHVRESPTPLRDILAQIYSGARPAFEEAR